MTFEQMSVPQAIDYCERHKNAFLSSLQLAGVPDGEHQFERVISGLRDGSISPAQLPELGMSFWEGPPIKEG